MAEMNLTAPQFYTSTATEARGRSWQHGVTAYTGFQTILPPNSPSCCGGWRVNTGYYSASSQHSGGANVTLCDGSVRFVSESIDCGNLEYIVSTASNADETKKEPFGISPFGVWGAMGSVNGGESVSM